MKKIEPAVFFPAALLVFAGVTFAVFAGETAEALFTDLRNLITETMGWVYTIGVGGFLVAVIVVALSDWGRIKLGPDDSEPEFAFAPWFAMLFSAGMGIGLMFFAVAEPVTHYLFPPEGPAATVDAARESMVLTFFHWGVHAWAVYAVVGLSLAYFSYRHGLPLTIRSALFPLIGERIHGPIGHTVDTIAILGTLFGVATSLGYGVTQINAGLNQLFGLDISAPVQVGLIVIITAMATVSVVAGLDAGIRRLSEWNLYLAIALLAFVFLAGPSLFLLGAFVQNLGDYIDSLAFLTFNVDAYGDGGWVNAWTLFYWGWWISWSPFVGMFIARISRGRTIRQFVFGVLFGPTLFTFLWMTIYGNSALREAIAGGPVGVAIMEAVSGGNNELALFAFLEGLPFASITSVLAVVLVTTFFVTSSDSGSLVKSTLATSGSLHPPVSQRLFWAILEGVVASILLLVGGLAALQAATIAAALPFTLVIMLAFVGLVRAWSVESQRKRGMRTAAQLPVQGAATPWRTRLRLMFSRPSLEEVETYIRDEVEPALKEVAAELDKHGYTTRVEGAERQVSLTVEYENNPAFVYGTEAKRHDELHFPGTPEDEDIKAGYARAEVFLAEGGKHYDVFGYSRTQIIRDVLKHFEHHLQWLYHMVR